MAEEFLILPTSRTERDYILSLAPDLTTRRLITQINCMVADLQKICAALGGTGDVLWPTESITARIAEQGRILDQHNQLIDDLRRELARCREQTRDFQ